jgi:hypothetical protein
MLKISLSCKLNTVCPSGENHRFVSTIVARIAVAANTTMYSKIILNFKQSPTISNLLVLFFILKIFLQNILKNIKKLIPPITV